MYSKVQHIGGGKLGCTIRKPHELMPEHDDMLLGDGAVPAAYPMEPRRCLAMPLTVLAVSGACYDIIWLLFEERQCRSLFTGFVCFPLFYPLVELMPPHLFILADISHGLLLHVYVDFLHWTICVLFIFFLF